MSRQSGELPPGWALTELGALSERRGGGTPSRSVKRYFQGNIPWVTVADLPPIGAAPPTILASREAITDEAIAASSAKPIPKDSVVFATRVSVGKVAIAGCTLATNQDFRSLLPGSAHEPAYIAWFLSHIAQFNLPANQGTTIKGITTSKFDGIQVPLPPLAEQRRIVAKIEALQEQSRRAREALSEVGPLLEQFRQSVLAAAFCGDLTADWRAAHPDVEPASELLLHIRTERRRYWEQAELAKYEAKGQKPPQNWKEKYKEPEPVDDSDLPELPEGWCWTRLPELGYMNRGKSRHRPRNAPHLYGGPYPFVQTGDIAQSCGRIVSHKQTYSEAGLAQSKLWPEGTVCITIAANIASSAILSYPTCFPDSIVGLIPDESLCSSDFVEFFIRTAKSDLERFAPSTAQKNINLETLTEVAVPLPPLEELKEITRLLTELIGGSFHVEQAVESLIDQTDHLNQSILAKAFSGELVPQDPSDEPASALLERIRAQRKQLAEAPKQTSKSHRTSKSGKKPPRLGPQQLTLAEVLRTADYWVLRK